MLVIKEINNHAHPSRTQVQYFMYKGHFNFISQSVFCCFIFFCLLLEGCAPSPLFYWGDYEDSLYERYVENDTGQTEVHLQESFAEAQKTSQRVPPGLYADYGFMLYKRGDKSGAITAFEQEKKQYPESALLMTKLIERVEQKKDVGLSKSNQPLKTGGQQ